MWKRNKKNKNFKRQHDEAEFKNRKVKQTLFTLTPHGHGGKFRIYRMEHPEQYALLAKITELRFIGQCRIENDYIMFEVKTLTFNALTSYETQFTMKCGFVECGPRCLRISCVSQSEGVPYVDFMAERRRIAKAKKDAINKAKQDKIDEADALLFDEDGFFMF